MVRAVRTPEAELLAALAGAFTLERLYDLVESAGEEVTGRDGGHDVVHGRGDTRWRRRVRNVLQTMRRNGSARRLGDRVWILEGTPADPRTVLLVSLSGEHAEVELRQQQAAELLRSLPTHADLVFADGPYGLGVGEGEARDTGARAYQRDESKVVPGYVDVDPDRLRIFTKEWVTAAAQALRPGGYLVAVTGPQQAAWTQVAAEDAGLTYCNALVVRHSFPLRATRRFAHSHWRVLIAVSGPLDSARRVFTPPADLPTARSGAVYPLDVWDAASVGRADARPGELRYRNSLPFLMVDRLVAALTRRPAAGQADLVVDPFVGGGTTALVALRRGLRFIGGDRNPFALAFTARRLGQDLRKPLDARVTSAPLQLALI